MFHYRCEAEGVVMKRLVILFLLAVPAWCQLGNATRIWGTPIAPTAPSDGQAQVYNGANARYQPATIGSGSVTSIATGCGTSGGTITATGTIIAKEATRLNTSVTDAIVAGDGCNLVTNTNAAAIAGSIAACGSTGFTAGVWFVDIQNRGAGTYTLTPTTPSTVDGAASIDLLTDQGIRLACGSDNQYYTQRGRGLMTGPGTVAGEYQMFELAANGSNFVSWIAPDSRATDARFLFPIADPTAGQAMVFGVPDVTTKKSTGTWITPLTSVAFSAVTAGTNTAALVCGSGCSISPSGGVVTANVLNTFNICESAAASPSCGGSNGGSAVIAAAATTVVIQTSLASTYGHITLTPDSSAAMGTRLSVTCNTTITPIWVSTRVGSTSFTVSTTAGPVANPMCFTWKTYD